MLPNRRHIARALALLTLLAAIAAASAAADPSPGELKGSIENPDDYTFASPAVYAPALVPYFMTPAVDEPTTDGSGSPCSSGQPGEAPWTFTTTYWYAASVGNPLLFELHSLGTNIALAVYAVADPSAEPTAADRIACVGGSAWTDTYRDLPVDPSLSYRFQFGVIGPGDPSGSRWDFRVGARAPNDEPQDATALSLDTPVLVSNFGASASPVERSLDCDPSHQGSGRSVWFRTTVTTPGSLRLDLQPMDVWGTPGYLSLFRADAVTMLACANGGFIVPTTQLTEEVQPGTYFVRVSTGAPLSSAGSDTWQSLWFINAHLTPSDLDRDGFYQPADCDDGDAAINPGAIDFPEDGVDQDCSGADAVNYDRDGDTYARPSDCNDGNAAIHPEATEAPDDGVDQNCDGHDDHRDSDNDGIADYRDRCPRRASGGIDADHDGCRDPFQLVVIAGIRVSSAGRGWHFELLTIRAARGARIVVTCTRHVCRRRSFTLRGTAVTLTHGFATRPPVGTVFTVAASKPGALGMVKRIRLTAAGPRFARTRCTAEQAPEKHVPCG